MCFFSSFTWDIACQVQQPAWLPRTLLPAVWQARSWRPSFWSSSSHLLSLSFGLGVDGLRHIHSMIIKAYRKVNKVIPVFLREKGCIEKFFVFPRAIKYCIFHSKIQGLPYILYTGFLYDGIIRKARSLTVIRFTGSLLRRGPVGTGHEKPLLLSQEGLFHQEWALLTES